MIYALMILEFIWAVGALATTPWFLYNLWKYSPDRRDFWFFLCRTIQFALLWPLLLCALFASGELHERR